MNNYDLKAGLKRIGIALIFILIDFSLFKLPVARIIAFVLTWITCSDFVKKVKNKNIYRLLNILFVGLFIGYVAFAPSSIALSAIGASLSNVINLSDPELLLSEIAEILSKYAVFTGVSFVLLIIGVIVVDITPIVTNYALHNIFKTLSVDLEDQSAKDLLSHSNKMLHFTVIHVIINVLATVCAFVLLHDVIQLIGSGQEIAQKLNSIATIITLSMFGLTGLASLVIGIIKLVYTIIVIDRCFNAEVKEVNKTNIIDHEEVTN